MKLVKGSGSPGTGACWMSAISWYAGEQDWNDAPKCVCPILRDLCIDLNDRLETDEERERIIGPIMFSVVGTNNDADTKARSRALQDEVVPKALPHWNDQRRFDSSHPHVVRASFTQAECLAAVKGHEKAESDVQQAIQEHANDETIIDFEIHAAFTMEEYVDLILRLAKIGTKAEVTQVRDMAGLPQ